MTLIMSIHPRIWKYYNKSARDVIMSQKVILENDDVTCIHPRKAQSHRLMFITGDVTNSHLRNSCHYKMSFKDLLTS